MRPRGDEAKTDPSLRVQTRVRLEYFRRFLSRVFSRGPDSDGILNGDTGMSARAVSARATPDVDLFRARQSIDGALRSCQKVNGSVILLP